MFRDDDPECRLAAQKVQPLDAQEVNHDIRVGNNDNALILGILHWQLLRHDDARGRFVVPIGIKDLFEIISRDTDVFG